MHCSHPTLLGFKKRSKNSFHLINSRSPHTFLRRENTYLLRAFIVVPTKTTWEEEEYHAKTTMVSLNARNREEEDDDHDFDKKKNRSGGKIRMAGKLARGRSVETRERYQRGFALPSVVDSSKRDDERD